jgi:hypothetical protein
MPVPVPREHNLIVFAGMAFSALPVLRSRHTARTVESEADACVILGIRRAKIPVAPFFRLALQLHRRPQVRYSALVRWSLHADRSASQTLSDSDVKAIEAKLAERAAAIGVSAAELKQMNITIPKSYKARDYSQ